MTTSNAHLKIEMELQAWADCPPDRDLDDFVRYMGELGNPVLEVDREGRRVLIMSERT